MLVIDRGGTFFRSTKRPLPGELGFHQYEESSLLFLTTYLKLVYQVDGSDRLVGLYLSYLL